MYDPKSRLTVALGSKNLMKKRAAEKVFSAYFDANVIMVPVSTGVSPQPVGLGELIKGAALRAVNSMKILDKADFGVGIEAGLLEFISSTGFIEVQVAVIVGKNGKASVGLSQGFELPPWIVNKMLQGIELSSASGIKRGSRDIGESIGYIGVKTWGRVTRQDLTEQALLMALIPWLEGADWLVSVEDLIAQSDHLPKPRPQRGGKN